MRTVRLLAGAAIAGAVALATLADTGLAQTGQPGTPAWLRARLDNRLDARTRAAVERVIDSALAAGVPAEPLVSKALQGAAMGAKGEDIVRVVRQLAGTLTTARNALGQQSLPAELEAGAEVLRVGVEPGALARLRREREGQPLAVALGVMADLIGRGVPVPAATQSVLSLTKAGVADEQLVAFRRDVERDIGIGAPPGVAATLRADAGIRTSRAREGTGPISPVIGRPTSDPRQKP